MVDPLEFAAEAVYGALRDLASPSLTVERYEDLDDADKAVCRLIAGRVRGAIGMTEAFDRQAKRRPRKK